MQREIKYEWISIKDKLPDSCCRVLASEKHGYQAVCLYLPLESIFQELHKKINATHWMPLPEAPKCSEK